MPKEWRKAAKLAQAVKQYRARMEFLEGLMINSLSTEIHLRLLLALVTTGMSLAFKALSCSQKLWGLYTLFFFFSFFFYSSFKREYNHGVLDHSIREFDRLTPMWHVDLVIGWSVLHSTVAYIPLLWSLKLSPCSNPKCFFKIKILE